MSREIGILKNTGSRKIDIQITRYNGHDWGPCLQLTAPMEDGFDGYIQLSARDAISLLPIFKTLIDDALTIKKVKADEVLKEYTEAKNTIIQEMSDVAKMVISQPLFDISALMCLGPDNFEKAED